MRPNEVTQEMIDGWERGRLEYEREQAAAGNHTIRPIPPVVWHCGEWLHSKLMAEGCDPKLASLVGQANGQRMAMYKTDRDRWAATVRTLENWRKGEVDHPGPELAKRLIIEKYGSADKNALSQYLFDSGMGGDVMEMMARFQARIPPGTPPDEARRMMKQMFKDEMGSVPETQEEFDKQNED